MVIDVMEKKTAFADIKLCECFMNALRNDVFMKRSNCETDNAISLKDGDLWDFDSDEEVIPVNARVVIE